MIRNIEDLSSHLHAVRDTSESIGMRIYKSTKAGCPAGVEEGDVGRKDIKYSVVLNVDKDGTVSLSSWAEHMFDGRRNFTSDWEVGGHGWDTVLPQGLQEYLCLKDDKKTLDHDISVADIFFGENDVQILDHTFSDGSKSLEIQLDLTIKEPVIGTYFYVTGYCEGSDREHEVHKVPFPCKAEDIDKAIKQAEEDSQETWDATHGCEQCHPQGTCDEWGNEFAPGEAGAPINPECKHCEGEGIIL